MYRYVLSMLQSTTEISDLEVFLKDWNQRQPLTPGRGMCLEVYRSLFFKTPSITDYSFHPS